ncbi:gliding motility-associated C-terminal domain-containing protein [Hymenobacter metallicola]|uniref:Gliding motility-associated C-terminal domain-containing protein n=1 Tax=Hymenobacter metallicola TaxID=2563114 RepID=A0A4Z0QCL9_9BACT|nr:gliding motility-associated C-terminal domain-containing protein [Hymenobacter metallicola]TGE27434.1 hypothetical protein E5K02_13730 [Hymenobacter metallicola]
MVRLLRQLARRGGLLLACFLFFQTAVAQTPTTLWQQAFGGTSRDHLTQMVPTPDGGCLLGGPSDSGLSGNKTTAQVGFWVIKLDASGTKQWERVHGNSVGLGLTRMELTADGGYILAGSSAAGASADKSQPSRGAEDYWVLKIDKNGSKQWDRTFGDSARELLGAVKPTTDGGYLLGGYSSSGISGDKTQPSRGRDDYWVVKIDGNGTKLWDRTLGGSESDQGLTLTASRDGGCLVGGYALSGISGDKTQAIRGSVDFWAVKLDGNGTKEWDRTYGGNVTDILTQICQTPDDGYLLGGYSGSDLSGDRTQPNRGSDDYWVVKINSRGEKEWDSSFGGSGQDDLRALQPTADGGYLLGGESSSGTSPDKSQPNRGFYDYWVLKLDGRGRKQWDRTFGTAGSDQVGAVLQNPDGTFLVGGLSSGGFSGDRTGPSYGDTDFWVLKLGATPAASPARTEIRGDSVLCGGQVLLTATTSVPAASFRWNTGATTRSLVATQLGTYSVTVTFPDGQTATDQQVVEPFTKKVRITGDSVLCAGRMGRLTGIAAGADGYYWSTGDSAATITVQQPGTYTVTAYFGVSCSATRQIVVQQVGASISGPSQLCTGASGVLTVAAPGATQLRWSTGATTATLPVSQAGTYSVVATFPNGCTATATQVVTMAAAPLRIIGGPTLCAQQPVALTAEAPGAVSYRWNTGATTASISVSQPGTYSVETTYANGCRNQAQQQVQQPTLANASLGADTTLCAGRSLVLRVPAALLAAGYPYQWSDGTQAPLLTARQPGTYALTYTTPCGPETIQRRISLGDCQPPANIITPNDDKVNDRWVVQGLPNGDYALEIYTRWGRKVYEAAVYHQEWGPGVAAGTYYYLLRHHSTGQTYRGWITVAQ